MRWEIASWKKSKTDFYPSCNLADNWKNITYICRFVWSEFITRSEVRKFNLPTFLNSTEYAPSLVWLFALKEFRFHRNTFVEYFNVLAGLWPCGVHADRVTHNYYCKNIAWTNCSLCCAQWCGEYLLKSQGENELTGLNWFEHWCESVIGHICIGRHSSFVYG